MRSSRMNGYVGEFRSSFLSCEKDLEEIVKKLFVDSKPYSDILKRLLVIQTKDCITDMTNPAYIEKLKKTSLKDLREQGYIKFEPRLEFSENPEQKAFIIISFDNFSPNATNDYFRDCIVEIDIICHPSCWDVGNYRLRPLKIAGYIDGILNGTRLSGLGEFQFLGCNELVLTPELSGYCLMYRAVHGVDDRLPDEYYKNNTLF